MALIRLTLKSTDTAFLWFVLFFQFSLMFRFSACKKTGQSKLSTAKDWELRDSTQLVNCQSAEKLVCWPDQLKFEKQKIVKTVNENQILNPIVSSRMWSENLKISNFETAFSSMRPGKILPFVCHYEKFIKEICDSVNFKKKVRNVIYSFKQKFLVFMNLTDCNKSSKMIHF